jgi:murein DD-endopeptidase MepM/ murein hydrolase activator NlpD
VLDRRPPRSPVERLDKSNRERPRRFQAQPRAPSSRRPWLRPYALLFGIALALAFGALVAPSSALLREAPARQASQVTRSLQLTQGSNLSRLREATSNAVPMVAPPTIAPTIAPPTLTPVPTATPEPPLCLEDPGQPLYCVYTVRPSDTLSGIARQLELIPSGQLSAAEMLAQSNKPEVVSSDQIQAGQKLRVPYETGILHTVLEEAETLDGIAASYGVTVEQIRAVPGNNIDGDLLFVGQDLLVPRPAHLPPVPEPVQPEPTPEPTETPSPVPTQTPVPNTPVPTSTPTSPPPRPTSTPAPPAPAVSRSGFIWPVRGPITSYFGPSHPLGIDIGLGVTTPPVVAAAAGTVTFAGGNPCCSYGFYVVVDHGGGVTTLYAHFSSIAVSRGQRVAQGQVLGNAGRTGYATGNHLHFEVRVNGAVQNPLAYLP